MENYKLGPNGSLVYCMEFLENNLDWLFGQVAKFSDHYFIFDMPGQVCNEISGIKKNEILIPPRAAAVLVRIGKITAII